MPSLSIRSQPHKTPSVGPAPEEAIRHRLHRHPPPFGTALEYGPAPFLLQSRLEGANYRGDIIRELSTSGVDRLARSTGRYLAELHSLDAVDGNGYVSIDPTETLTGQRQSGGSIRSSTTQLTALHDSPE